MLSKMLPVAPGETLNVKSPLSKTIIISYDGTTKKTRRQVCAECLQVVRGERELVRPIDDPRTGAFFENGIGDPIYFLAAGVEYGTIVTPVHGRVAWELSPYGESAIRTLIKGFSPHLRKSWYKRTGTPFPHWLYK